MTALLFNWLVWIRGCVKKNPSMAQLTDEDHLAALISVLRQVQRWAFATRIHIYEVNLVFDKSTGGYRMDDVPHEYLRMLATASAITCEQTLVPAKWSMQENRARA